MLVLNQTRCWLILIVPKFGTINFNSTEIFFFFFNLVQYNTLASDRIIHVRIEKERMRQLRKKILKKGTNKQS